MSDFNREAFPDMNQQEMSLLIDSKRIQAIGQYRQRLGISLADAKNVIEWEYDKLLEHHTPDDVELTILHREVEALLNVDVCNMARRLDISQKHVLRELIRAAVARL